MRSFLLGALVGLTTATVSSCTADTPTSVAQLTTATSPAGAWRLEELPAPPSGWSGVTPRAINSAGQIVGEYRTNIALFGIAFVFDGTTWTSLGTLGGVNSQARGLNDRGEIVGWSETSRRECSDCGLEIHAFVWRDGVLQDLGAEGSYSEATGINDAGTIVGRGGDLAQRWGAGDAIDVFGTFGGTCQSSFAEAVNSRGHVVGSASTSSGSHAFLWDEREGLRDLGTLGGPNSVATAISEAGHVVGYSETARAIACTTNQWGTFCMYEMHPFLWKDGVMTDLGTLGGPHADAFGVNSLGEIVGGSETTETLRCFVEGGFNLCVYRIHAVVWSGGQMVDLGEPGRTSFATGINEQGDIVGVAEREPRVYRPVIWRKISDEN